jgi:hypothetical protein
MFRELGWDVDNTQGFAEQYREVVYEDRVKVGGATKAPDYSFRIGGPRKFFLEAKKPFVNLKESWEPAYQLRRYGWSAKLAVSLLTDFEEFAIYDCRIQPKQFDKPSTARREYITYRQYEEKSDFLSGTFKRGKRTRCDCRPGMEAGGRSGIIPRLAESFSSRSRRPDAIAPKQLPVPTPASVFRKQRLPDTQSPGCSRRRSWHAPLGQP